ncbi:MAG: efflux RND transporter periplasmic adaptor subunit [Gammaproteobacteria bacterium]|nr:efflux RND transporter periplasmic adaptor subunit [Gammaproteobacteria bacterium]MBU2057070.1 efflux RND transporter periplasmic adaptor subunit [Gammaproteobacteria bacterium]MBU2175129.1 efflux RND transporter periplasmic adaptor subunit [Gammaproteobacteria bacterium]MBU2245160.1 efflux RND transporter periplasmic adaptor subunit [Gammaproteobacteria bacterium]MBU2343973.1 efflux RND transporter periplasmic adaptor subunit [Gammaproteobacteria bacterium]
MYAVSKANKAISAVIFFSLILCSYGCQKAPETEASPAVRLVLTQRVESSSTENWREFPGTVQAGQQADLSFRLAGKLASILLDEGDQIEQGQVLATLEDADYQIQLHSAKAEYTRASAEFARAGALLAKQLISQTDYDKMQAQYVAAQASLEGARQNLQYTIIKAPFSGIVARRYVDNFEDVSAQQSIVTIQDLSTLRIKVDIPETVMIRLKQHSQLKVYAAFDALPEQRFPLTLHAVSTEADPVSQTYSVTFSMSASGGANILPGMSLTVRGTQLLEENSIVIPTHVVAENANGRFVYVVQHNGDGTGIVNMRQVSTGPVNEQGITILSGLSAGETIVTAGMSKMSDGLQVRLTQGVQP